MNATLEPLLATLGPEPRAEEILELKICDPAMGSGAFLVETCRQLAEQLGGEFHIASRPGEGTEAWIDLPAAEAAERSTT